MKLSLSPLRVTLLLLAGLTATGVLFPNRPVIQTEAADARVTVKLLDNLHKG